MNLHIVTDSKLAATFIRNLSTFGLSATNKVFVRSNASSLKNIAGDFPFGNMYSRQANDAIGDTSAYDNVFIHQFSPLMYRWVARNTFKAVHWMVWGGDIYNLPGIENKFYEPRTMSTFVRRELSLSMVLYRAKIFLTNTWFRRAAYAKINTIFTWMQSEYEFCKTNLPLPNARHEFFFYLNEVPYGKLDPFKKTAHVRNAGNLKLIIGNSGTPTNNHLDTIQALEQKKIKADLFLPVSYGDAGYIQFLKRHVSSYTGGKITFIEESMAFDQYVNFLVQADALVMNNIRPQGYGNILMMLYLGRPVFLNDKNISIPDLKTNGINTPVLSHLSNEFDFSDSDQNKEGILKLFSEDKLREIYRKNFTP